VVIAVASRIEATSANDSLSAVKTTSASVSENSSANDSIMGGLIQSCSVIESTSALDNMSVSAILLAIITEKGQGGDSTGQHNEVRIWDGTQWVSSGYINSIVSY
jgi:hypothetical protein